jgi:hypothetical protein
MNASARVIDGQLHYLDHTDEGLCRIVTAYPKSAPPFVFSATPVIEGDNVVIDLLFSAAPAQEEETEGTDAARRQTRETRARVRVPKGETAVIASSSAGNRDGNSATVLAVRPRILEGPPESAPPE